MITVVSKLKYMALEIAFECHLKQNKTNKTKQKIHQEDKD